MRGHKSERSGRRRERQAHPRARKPYLLGGLIRCRHCGYGFWGVAIRTLRRGSVRYYADGGFLARGLAVCRSTQIRADELEAWVLGKVRDMIFGNAETMTAAVDRFVKNILAKDGGNGHDIAAVEKELAALNKRIRATAAMLADSNLADLEELKATLVELKRRREVLEARKTQVAANGEPLDERALRQWATDKFRRMADAAEGSLPLPETKQLLQTFIDRIEIDPERRFGCMYVPADAHAHLAETTRRGHHWALAGPCVMPTTMVQGDSLGGPRALCQAEALLYNENPQTQPPARDKIRYGGSADVQTHLGHPRLFCANGRLGCVDGFATGPVPTNPRRLG